MAVNWADQGEQTSHKTGEHHERPQARPGLGAVPRFGWLSDCRGSLTVPGLAWRSDGGGSLYGAGARLAAGLAVVAAWAGPTAAEAPECMPVEPHWNTQAGDRLLTFDVLIWSSKL